MSDTWKTKNYAKARNAWRADKDERGISDFWDNHRFRYHKTPRGGTLARFIIQTMGHKRRRAEERKVSRLALLVDGHYTLDDVGLRYHGCLCCECQ